MTVRKILILLGIVSVFGVIAPVSAADWFENKAQQAKKSFQAGDYDAAAEDFDDSYRRGVSLYRAEKYDEAARSFSEANRESIASAGRYNLGNSHFKLGQYDKAIEAYESIEEGDPLYDDARFNLDLAQRLMQQQEQEKSQQKSDNQSGEQSGEPSDEQSDQQKDGEQSDSSSSDGQQGDGEKSASEENNEPESGESEQASNSDSESDDSATQKQQTEPEGSKPNNIAENQSESAPEFDQQQSEAGDDADTTAPQSQPVPIDAATAQQNQLAEQWLNRVGNDPSRLLKNQFYITEQEAETKSGAKPW